MQHRKEVRRPNEYVCDYGGENLASSGSCECEFHRKGSRDYPKIGAWKLQFKTPTQTQYLCHYSKDAIRLNFTEFKTFVNEGLPENYDRFEEKAFYEDCAAVWQMSAMKTLRQSYDYMD